MAEKYGEQIFMLQVFVSVSVSVFWRLVLPFTPSVSPLLSIVWSALPAFVF
jgi:hypothetical protein